MNESDFTWWETCLEKQRAHIEFGLAIIEQMRATFERNEVLASRWLERAQERQAALAENARLFEQVKATRNVESLPLSALQLTGEISSAHLALSAAIAHCLASLNLNLAVAAGGQNPPTEPYLETWSEVDTRCETVYALFDRYNQKVDAFIEEMKA